MNPDGADLLSQLRDIHAAPPTPFWPPAPGWWVLAAIALLLMAWAVRRLVKLRARRARRRRVLERLDGLRTEYNPAEQPQGYLSGVNQLLKIVALRAFPDSRVASLEGSDWVNFLRYHLSEESRALDVLQTGPYQSAPVFDAAEVHGMARQWIERHG